MNSIEIFAEVSGKVSKGEMTLAEAIRYVLQWDLGAMQIYRMEVGEEVYEDALDVYSNELHALLQQALPLISATRQHRA